MKNVLTIEPKTELIGIASEVVYLQKPYWCNANVRQLKLSVMKPRHWYDYDHKDRRNPVIMFFCGGGFAKQDINVWNAELAFFAKRGYAVITAEYSVLPYTKWPEQICELKAAVRYVRAHAEELNINADKIAVMGESAGGFLAAAMAVTSGTREFDTVGGYMEQSSAVQCAVPWWPVVNMGDKPTVAGMDTSGFINCTDWVTSNTPPMALFHGTKDHLVPQLESEIMYEALQKAGVDSELYIIEGADHADLLIMQDEVKELMVSFLDKHMK